MNRPKIFVVPPEHIAKAWPSVEALEIIAPVPESADMRNNILASVLASVESGEEELHAVVDGAGETVACFTVSEGKGNGLIVRFVAGKDAPVWLGYIMRNIFELASNRGLSYAKVISRKL
jgi:hypothetical protein